MGSLGGTGLSGRLASPPIRLRAAKGRSFARDPEPVRPVSEADIEAISPFVCRQVRSIIQLQLLSGCRPGEIVTIRTRDLDRTTHQGLWFYSPSRHKTSHRDTTRVVCFSSKAQTILAESLKADQDAFLFSPKEAHEERMTLLRAIRKSKIRQSQQDRRTDNPKRQPQEQYSVMSYRNAIARAYKQAKVTPWHPHQLRHTFATKVSREHGLEPTRILLGHAYTDMSEIYTDRGLERIPPRE